MKIITSQIVVSYYQCPIKAFILLCRKIKGNKNEYTDMLNKQKNKIERIYLKSIHNNFTEVKPYEIKNINKKYEVLTNATIEINGLSADCPILIKVNTPSALGRYSYEPTIFMPTYHLTMMAKLELFFVSYTLGILQGKHPKSGRIVGLDLKSHKVRLEKVTKILFPFLEPIVVWAEDESPKYPPLILNKNCSICQFQQLCRSEAEEKDHLSLLGCISTQKAISKYKKKGLFTVKQLSYTFKPRKRKKQYKNPAPLIHKPELQALAIREKKIFLQELPKLNRQPVELFLDIEGIPDQRLYYLLGLIVSKDGTTKYHPFWADSSTEEEQEWFSFRDLVLHYPDAPIYHYGRFEARALSTLSKRYNSDIDSITERLENVINLIYGKIYFPVFSNSLKDIGPAIGATWTSFGASGIKSLVWRYNWENTKNLHHKKLLIEYNYEDCYALKLLIEKLSRIANFSDTISEIDFANKPKSQATKIGIGIHNQFESILKSSHFIFKNKKISFVLNEKNKDGNKKKRGPPVGHKAFQKKIPKTSRIFRLPRRRKCTLHKSEVLQESEILAERTVIDLVFMKSGVRKTITKYFGTKSYCQQCHRYYNPIGIDKIGNKVFGHSFQTWVIYQRIVLRLPYGIITQAIDAQFNESLSQGTIVNFFKYFADKYSDTDKIIINKILDSPFIHVDETKINIQGMMYYVWVLTDNKHVCFKLTETRESKFIHDILSNYEGVLISDFFPGYDSMKCRQQKCWGHLIRGINNDLLASPFDTEFELFVVEVRNMIVPIMEAVQKYGLKKRNLKKFGKMVDKFYKSVIIGNKYESELAIKYRKRFDKYSDRLFIFLEEDDIPWHNNTAERALRHLAVQRKISGFFFESGTHRYLILLGIMQTCKLQNKSFLKFLLSGDKDVDLFNGSKRGFLH